MTMGRLVQTLCAVGVAAMALLITNEAAAQRTAVILDFDGRGAGIARRSVVRALSDELELERSSDFESRARDLGADLGSPPGVAQVANDMGVDLVVRGEVSGRGRRAETVIRVLDSDGNEVARRQAGSPATRRGQRRIGEAALEAVNQAIEELDRRDAEAAAAQDTAAGGGLGGDLGLGEGLDEELGEDEEEDEPGEPAAVPYLELMGAIGLRSRNGTIDLDPAGSRGYDALLFWEIGLWAELRPFAGDDGALRGLFVQAELFHSIFLTSEEEVMDDVFEPVDSTNAFRVFGQLGYLLGVGDGELGGGLGFGYDAFTLSENGTMPSTQYTYLRPALTFRHPLVDDLLGLRLGGGLRVVMGTGDLAPFFAEDASAFGFDLGAAAVGRLTDNLSYGLHVGYTGYSLGFDGVGQGSDAMDPADDVTATGGFDGYVNVTARFGYQFR